MHWHCRCYAMLDLAVTEGLHWVMAYLAIVSNPYKCQHFFWHSILRLGVRIQGLPLRRHTSTCMYNHTHTCTHIHIYIYTSIHLYSNTCMYIHTSILCIQFMNTSIQPELPNKIPLAGLGLCRVHRFLLCKVVHKALVFVPRDFLWAFNLFPAI